jgi:hypothetical protein
MAQQNNGSIKMNGNTAAEREAFRLRLEEIEESMVREASSQIAKGHTTLAASLLERVADVSATLDIQEIINEPMFRAILSTELRYSAFQINTEVTLVRCRLADVPEAWDMGGQASTKLHLQAAA